jgi:catechol 2,3-dioxygenase
LISLQATSASASGLDISRTADHQIADSIYMRDPDGNVVEFCSDNVEDWRLHGESISSPHVGI